MAREGVREDRRHVARGKRARGTTCGAGGRVVEAAVEALACATGSRESVSVVVGDVDVWGQGAARCGAYR